MTDEKRAEPTPGPWTFTRALTPSDGGYDYGIGATVGDKNHCIAEVIEVLDYDLRVNAEANARLIAAAPDTAAERDRLKAANAELAAVVTEWLPIVQRQLDGLLRAAEAQDGAKSLFESAAWKAANERVERMRAALAKQEPTP